MENVQDLSQTLGASWKTLQMALQEPLFYVELVFIGLAVAVAWVGAFIIYHHAVRYLQSHPPQKIDKGFILRPLLLLFPIFTLLMLSLMKPLVQQYAHGSVWIEAAIKLAFSLIIARIILLVIKTRAIAYFLAFVVMAIAGLSVTGFMASTTQALDGIAFNIGSFKLSMLALVKGVIILVVVFWGANLLASTLQNYLLRSSRLSYSTRELVVKFFKIFVYVAAFLITLSAMGIDLTALAIFSGALGVGVGLGLQKVTSNFVSGVTILLEKSIKIGDLIEIGTITGWVRQLNMRYALIEGFDGREMLVPNEMLLASQVINWTYSNDFARVEIKVGVAYGSDPMLVRQLLLAAAHDHPKTIKTPEATCFLREFGDSALYFLLNFWIQDVRDGRYQPQSEVMMDILARFAAHNIHIPFPQRVVHVQQMGA